MILQSKIFWECYEEETDKNRCKTIKGTIEVYDVGHNGRGAFDVRYKKSYTATTVILPHWISSGRNSLYFLLISSVRNITEELVDLQYNGNLVNYRRVK